MIIKIQKKTKIHLQFLFLSILLLGCQDHSNLLYQSKEFTVYSDKVIQGKYESIANSSTNLVSNYISNASANYSRLITFKFSINEKDNEMISGQDHWIIVGDEHVSPILQFGKPDGTIPDDPGTKLPVNYDYTFRVDMNEVLGQFNEKGYYLAFDGSRIAKTDFKALYIAGGSKPLTWDFSNLEENALELKDKDGDGIYELTLKLNPFNAEENKAKEWMLSSNLSAKPVYHSDHKIVDALFNLSLEEALMNIESDSTLRTGAKWGGVWTRDVSYSTLLAFAFHEPEVARISLMKKVKRGRIIQDTGSGGAWPVSSDRTTWALAAWEIYKVTGDWKWLEDAYTIIKNTLEDDHKTLVNENNEMYKGESSFLDWREQTYPKWMSNVDIYTSRNLGTNVVHYQAHIILAEMAKLLGEPYLEYVDKAEDLKSAINQSLWMKDKGYYAQYQYGRDNLNLSPKFEALGESLAILFGVADSEQAKSIIEQSPVTPFGTTCIYPQIPGIPPYHNNGIWPFVQSFWNLAAAKTGNEKALEHGLASIYRAGALFLSNYENFVAENGDYVGTEINSNRMLWSMAGNLAMVHRLFMGMNFEVDGIRFQPIIPKVYKGTKSLSNFKYRNTKMDITVEGFGDEISVFKLDGEILNNAFIPSILTGSHKIEIIMKNNDFKESKINLQAVKFSLPTPHAKLNASSLSWDEIEGAISYAIVCNGKIVGSQNTNSFEVRLNEVNEYQVKAIDAEGFESFLSEPVLVYSKSKEQIFELENIIEKSDSQYSNFSGNGFIEISTTKNLEISIPVSIREGGKYRMDIRYSNGAGPWNTDNNCAIRSLYVNEKYEGVFVFPQRGKDEWSDWSFSNCKKVNLQEGTNTIKIILEGWNTNMDGEINEAMLDFIRVVRLDDK